MLQSAVSLHVVAEFFDVCALYLPEMKKRFWASGCNWRHVLESWDWIKDTPYTCFLVNVGWEMKNDRIITKRISGFIIQSEPTAQETYQNRIKIGHQPQRVHVNHYHHQSVKLNLLVKTAWVRMGGREGGPISGCYATAPWAPDATCWDDWHRRGGFFSDHFVRLLQWPLGQASAVEIYI